MQQHKPKEDDARQSATRLGGPAARALPERGAGPDEPVAGRCNAQLRGKPGRLCRQWAGARTEHKGDGRCWLHGGAPGTGAPEGNENAAKHGLSRRQLLVHYRPSMRALLEQAQDIASSETEADRLKGRLVDELAWCDAAEAQLQQDWIALEKRILEAGGEQAVAQLSTSKPGRLLDERQHQIKRRRLAVHRLYLETLKTMADLRMVDDSEREELEVLVLGRSKGGDPLPPLHVHPGSSLEDIRRSLGLSSPSDPEQLEGAGDVANPQP